MEEPHVPSMLSLVVGSAPKCPCLTQLTVAIGDGECQSPMWHSMHILHDGVASYKST